METGDRPPEGGLPSSEAPTGTVSAEPKEAAAEVEPIDLAKAKRRELFGSDDEDADPLLAEKYGGDENQQAEEQKEDSGEEAKKEEEEVVDSQPAEEAEAPRARRRYEIEYTEAETFSYWDQPQPPKDAKLHFVKLPSFVQIETKPYSRETYEEEVEPETAIRWRKVTDEHGKEKIESNTRLVRWSDGSVQLIIGAGEPLRVDTQDISRDQNFLFSMHPGFVLRAQAKLAHRMNIQPPAGGKAHQALTLSILEKSQQNTQRKKQAKIFTPVIDPKKELEERIRKESERLRASKKLETKKAAKRDSYLRGGRLTATFLEDDMGEGGGDEEEGNLGRIKAAYKSGADVRRRDEEEEEAAERRILDAKSAAPVPLPARKRRARDEEDIIIEDEEEGEEEAPEEEEEEDEEEEEPKDEKGKEEKKEEPGPERKRKGHVLDDDDE